MVHNQPVGPKMLQRQPTMLPLPRCRHGRSGRYAALALLIAHSLTLGLMLVRALEQSSGISVAALWLELQSDAFGYGYVLSSTSITLVALAVWVGRAQGRLQQQSLTCPLTNLGNRRAFMARITEEVARAERYATPLTVLLVDIDWLKAINDGGGHQAGDAAIITVANTLQKTLRVTDFVARHGGDEFAAILPQTRAQEAMGLARRIVALVGQQPIPGDGDRKSGRRMSVSIGVADLDGRLNLDINSLFVAADAALYAAKEAGRGRVRQASGSPLRHQRGTA